MFSSIYSTGQKLLKSGLPVLAFLTFLGGLANISAQAVLALSLTPRDLGEFANILGQANLLVPICSLGVYGVWVRLFAEKHENLGGYVDRGIYAANLASLIAYAIFVGFGFLIGAGVLYALIGITLIARSLLELLGGSLQSEQKYSHFALLQFWPHMLRVAVMAICAISVALMEVDNLLVFSAAQAFFAICVIVPCLLLLVRYRKRFPADHSDKPRMGTLLKYSRPFLVASFLFTGYTQAGIIVSAQIVGLEEGGYYALASTIAAGGFMTSSVVYQRFFQPRMFRWRIENKVRLITFFRKWFVYSFLAAVACLILFYLLGSLLVPIFGLEYQGAADILPILGIAVGIRFLVSHCSTVLVRQVDLDFRARSQLYAFLLALALMVVAGYLIGLLGIVLGAIFYELFMLVMLSARARKVVFELEQGTLR